jgi:uncharacterized protein
MTEPSAAPVTAAERIDLLDGLRGFALFGILLANILYWSGWLFLPHDRAIAISGETQFVVDAFLHKLLIDGKFYTIFSLLFGLGFALQLSRLERRGADGVRIFRRRLLVLLAIGLVHLCLIWDGDILTLYALLGLLLPFFRKWSERSLLIAALAFLLLPLAAVPLFRALGWAPWAPFYEMGGRIAESQGLHLGQEADWLARPDWHSRLVWVESGTFFRIAMLLEWWRLPKVFGIMLIGMAMGRRLMAGSLLEDRKLLRRVAIWGAVIGLPFSFLYALDAKAGQDSWTAILGTAPLGFSYAAAFALLWPHAKWLAMLASPGRMALTNYLMHSLLGITIFYGVGFGLVNHLPPLGFYAVAVAIFAFQILFSRWWLSRHAQGPMEWLWRRGTYGRHG